MPPQLAEAPRKELPAVDMKRVVQACLDSDGYRAEVRYTERYPEYKVSREPRLYKVLHDGHVRVVFPVECGPIQLASVVAITCLYDIEKGYNVYGHTICAGPGVNVLLKAIHAPLGNANSQPGLLGERAVLRFVDWKRAAWDKFLLDELDLGSEAASDIWKRNFWKALDRLFGGGYLLNCPDDYHWKG
jgi:hypothetical protein